MPQLDIFSFNNQIIWFLIIFILLYFYCIKFLLPNLFLNFYIRSNLMNYLTSGKFYIGWLNIFSNNSFLNSNTDNNSTGIISLFANFFYYIFWKTFFISTRFKNFILIFQNYLLFEILKLGCSYISKFFFSNKSNLSIIYFYCNIYLSLNFKNFKLLS